MKSHLSKSRVMAAALVSLTVAAATLVVGAAPALALSFSSARVPGHGFAPPAQDAGGGTSIASVAVVVAILAATIAFGVIGWRYDRRRLERSPLTTPASGEAAAPRSRPSAAKPLPTRAAAGVHARRRDDRRHQSQM
jgi:hypothetical protein